jgi:hypothetical protein
MSDPKFDAVRFVRQVRDEMYEETKDMSSEELIVFYRRRAAKTLEKLKQAQPERAGVSKGRV